MSQTIHAHSIPNESSIAKIIALYCLIWKCSKYVMISSTLIRLFNFANTITVDV